MTSYREQVALIIDHDGYVIPQNHIRRKRALAKADLIAAIPRPDLVEVLEDENNALRAAIFKLDARATNLQAVVDMLMEADRRGLQLWAERALNLLAAPGKTTLQDDDESYFQAIVKLFSQARARMTGEVGS